MEISVAGAGAGKTTKMADKIIDTYDGMCDGKIIYCITFTNNAAKCIEKKLIKHFTIIPKCIKISTIHSFLYQELIKPYYYLLYQKHFDKISTIALPTDIKYKNSKIRQLENSNILHTSVFTEKVKWILVKKAKDGKLEKKIRAMILRTFSQYCGSIFIDEAQDIDSNFVEILKKINECEIQLEIMGDPKQDLKGFNSLRILMEGYSDKVTYINSCHRCPQNHLNLSNSIFPKTEWQQSKKPFGVIKIEFENELNVKEYIYCH